MKLVVLVIGLILISGCLPTTSFGTLGGVELEFLDGNPPNEVNVDEEFGISVRATNGADCDAIGNICVSSSLEDGVEEGCQEISLDGVDEYGEHTTLSSEDLSFSEGYSYGGDYVGLSQYDTISAAVSYDCALDIRPNVCIKYDLDVKECGTTETISGDELNGMVGPLTVTKIKKTLIRKEGEGVLLKADIYWDKLSSGTPTTYYGSNQFYADIDYDQEDMECDDVNEEGIYEWRPNTEKVIKCKKLVYYTGGESEKYDLDIHLDYTYADVYTKKIIIKSPIEEGY